MTFQTFGLLDLQNFLRIISASCVVVTTKLADIGRLICQVRSIPHPKMDHRPSDVVVISMKFLVKNTPFQSPRDAFKMP